MRIGALTPVRLASERLPGKALMDVAGQPMIFHLLDRMENSPHIADRKDVVVCTTTDPRDDPLEAAVVEYGASIFRGEVDDIIKRFGDAISHFGFDAVIQADGDDPLSAPEYMHKTMTRLLEDPEIDIVTSTGLPLGCNVKSFTRGAMEKVLSIYKTEKNDTGFADYFTKTGVCRHVEVSPHSPEHIHDTVRLTLDYEVDLDVFRRIFAALYKPGEVFGMADVVSLVNAHPEWVEINRSVEEEYWVRHQAKSNLRFVDPEGVEKDIE